MPGKKKKAKKKKSVKVVEEATDPPTLVSGDEVPERTKKKKLTKAEKAMVALEKKTDDLKKSGATFEQLLSRLVLWVEKNNKRITTLFSKYDHDGLRAVTYEEFKAGMMDLCIPLNSVELHLFCQLLDPEGLQEVDYLDIEESLKLVRSYEDTLETKDIRPSLVPTKRQFDHCPKCSLVQWDADHLKEEFPRFIEVLFKLVTFENFRNHPGHFNTVVRSDITIQALIEIIKEHTLIQSSTIVIFADNSREKESILELHSNLEECGFKGGSRDHPEELLLFYDYTVEFLDNPLLVCDHYFGGRPKKQN